MEKSFLQLMIHDIKIIFITIFIILLLNSRFLIQLLRKEINIDNKIGYDKEDDIDFSGYSSTVKPIAIYNINNNIIKKKYLIYLKIMVYMDLPFIINFILRENFYLIHLI